MVAKALISCFTPLTQLCVVARQRSDGLNYVNVQDSLLCDCLAAATLVLDAETLVVQRPVDEC